MTNRKLINRTDTVLVVGGLIFFLYLLVTDLIGGGTNWVWLVADSAFALYCVGYLVSAFAPISLTARFLAFNGAAIVSGIALIFTFTWFGFTQEGIGAVALSLFVVALGLLMAVSGIRRVDAFNRAVDA